jgi:hypothetical protein
VKEEKEVMFDNKMLKRIFVLRELNNGRMEIFTK